MYRLIVESLLGLRREGEPCASRRACPADWESFKVHYRYRETVYHITVLQPGDGGAAGVTVDGVEQAGAAIPLVDDRREHAVDGSMRSR